MQKYCIYCPKKMHYVKSHDFHAAHNAILINWGISTKILISHQQLILEYKTGYQINLMA